MSGSGVPIRLTDGIGFLQFAKIDKTKTIQMGSLTIKWHTTSISFAMGWTSVVRLPIQKMIRVIDDENKN